MKRDFFIIVGMIFVIFIALWSFPINNTTNVIESSVPSSNYVTINLPAVDNKGNGIVAQLKVQSLPGEGKILTNINQLSLWVDTQDSIRTAEMVAENITGRDISKIDLVYSIQTDASLIEGPSAGAALTIATIAVLENKQLNQNVMITGTINSDGTIGKVGSILEKAVASKKIGIKIFLVPVGEGYETNYLPEKTCSQHGSITFCTTKYKSEKVNISESTGIEVKEVATINDALKYFIS